MDQQSSAGYAPISESKKRGVARLAMGIYDFFPFITSHVIYLYKLYPGRAGFTPSHLCDEITRETNAR
jgi:hypothetical protein